MSDTRIAALEAELALARHELRALREEIGISTLSIWAVLSLNRTLGWSEALAAAIGCTLLLAVHIFVSKRANRRLRRELLDKQRSDILFGDVGHPTSR